MQEESWDQHVRDADEISAECVSGPSKQIYQSRINVYVAALTKMNIEPYPITIEKMKGFLMKLVRDKKQFTTIQSYIAGFSFYFRQNDLDVLTNSIEFKNFKSGLRRKLQGSKCPKAKLPFDPSWFEIIFQKFPPNNVYDRKFFFYMTISFCAFLRISELRNLKYKDLVLSDDKSTLSILIESSKTDQFGRGIQTYVYNNNKIWCPICTLMPSKECTMMISYAIYRKLHLDLIYIQFWLPLVLKILIHTPGIAFGEEELIYLVAMEYQTL